MTISISMLSGTVEVMGGSPRMGSTSPKYSNASAQAPPWLALTLAVPIS